MYKGETIKNLLQNISVVVLLNLLVKPVWVLTENLVHTSLGHQVYGTYASLFSLVLVFSVLADWGISNYVVNQVAANKEQYAKVFSTFFVIRVAIMIVFPLFMVVVGWLLGYDEDELYLLMIIALTQSIVYFLAFFRAKLQAFQDFKVDGLMSVLERAILIVVVLVLLGPRFNLHYFVTARLGAIALACIMGMIVVIQSFGWVQLRFSGKEAMTALKAAFPFTIMTLLYAFNERVDMVMVERFNSKYEAGLYAGAYRWYDGFMMFVWLTQAILFSKFSQAKGESSGASSLFNQGFLLVSIPMLLITPTLFFDGKMLFFLFDQKQDLDIFHMTRLFQVLLISFIFNAFFVIQGTYLNASGHVKKVNWAILAAALLNVVLNAIFVPSHGALAAAITTAISTGCLGLSYFVMVMFSRLRIDLKSMAGVFVALAFSFVFYYYLKIHLDTPWISALASLAGFALGLILFDIPAKIKQHLG